MAKQKNLSQSKDHLSFNHRNSIFAILVSEWNREITGSLLDGAVETLVKHGVDPETNIVIEWVPGSFELPQAAAILAQSPRIHAVICLGCVIQGETRHFEFISQAVAQGCMKEAIDNLKPVIFGVLTTDNYEQARERSGGTHGNKGDEAALAALQMVTLRNRYFVDDLPDPDDFGF